MATAGVRDSFKIRNRLGLHLRAAVQLVECAGEFEAEIWLSKDGRTVSAKSVIDVVTLGAPWGSWVEVVAEGSQAAEAVRAIGKLIRQGFYEER